ncbi:MAG: acyl-CoA thioesterase [Lysobacter sp.]|nr:MAG: acyl-CoA thioesterase [Lysobacter sp.]
MTASTALFRMPIDLRWRDLDAFNHVNNANFMTYLEEARIRWLDGACRPWIDDTSIPLLAAVQMNYRLPIPYPADVAVELFAEKIGHSSLTLGHRIVDNDGRLYADGHCVLVWIERDRGRPTAMPEAVRNAASASAGA